MRLPGQDNAAGPAPPRGEELPVVLSVKSMIEYKCPHCQTELEAEDDQVGKRVLCPECKSSVLIPASQHQQRVDQLLDPQSELENLSPKHRQHDFEFDFDQLAPDEIEQVLEQPSHNPPPQIEAPKPAEPAPEPTVRRAAPRPLPEHQRKTDALPFGVEKPEKKPREEDLSPLRIDDISPEVEVGETASVICRICDTRIVFPKSQIGTKLKCPECFTVVDAVPSERPRDPSAYFPEPTETLEVVASPDGDLKIAEPDHVKRYRDQDDELTGLSSHREFSDPDGELFGDVGEQLPPLAGTVPPPFSLPQSPATPARQEKSVRASDDDELKLEAETPKVKPKHSLWIESELSPADDPHATDESPSPLRPAARTDPEKPTSTTAETKPIAPQTSPLPRQPGVAARNTGQTQARPPSTPASPEPPQRNSAATPETRPQPTPGNPYRPPPADPVDEEELERERNPLGMSMKSLNFGDNKLFQWVQQVYGDWQLSLRLLIIAVGLAAAYWLLGIAQSYAADEQSTAATRSLFSVLCGLPGLMLFLFAWGALFAIGGLLLEAGGNRRPRVEDWSGQAFGNYLQHLVLMLFAFWLAAIPGLFLGVALYLLTKSFLGTGLLVAFSAYILSPLMYYGGLSNGSAFWIIPRNLGDLFASTTIDWVRYVPVSLICWGIFLVGSLLLIPGGMLWCLLGSLLHIGSFTVFASLIGLYCGLLGDTMREEEERKALVEKLKQKAAENSR